MSLFLQTVVNNFWLLLGLSTGGLYMEVVNMECKRGDYAQGGLFYMGTIHGGCTNGCKKGDYAQGALSTGGNCPQDLQHMNWMLLFLLQECTQPITLYSAQKLWNMIPSGIQWFLFRTGIYAGFQFETGGFIRTKEGVPHPDIQFHFLPLATRDHGRYTVDMHAYQVSGSV